MEMNHTGRRIEVRGTVQGVGFRPWIWRLARQHGIAGRVSNDSRGVTIDAFGTHGAIESFLREMRDSPPPAAEIRELSTIEIPADSGSSDAFVIVPSRRTAGLEISIPADLATCDDCLAEVFDPADRRYRYPFTNCTNCGPRFTIANGIPYDRGETSMASFPMCEPCRAEYENPADRRFHAQPNACPACGPTLVATDAGGAPLSTTSWPDAVARTARMIRAGLTVAVKGLGGFHLACDATSEKAVARLRRRKRREEKPLAVMVRGIDEAEEIGVLTAEERRLLLSTERPIVLVRRRPGSRLAEGVAPDNPLVGILLAYTPLHHLLLADAGVPLVMTSGNLSEEPIACGNDEALRRLVGIADGFLLHDRDIASRCDDSVARVVAGGPVLLRRSRGWVPRPIPVDPPFPEPVLAVGGHLKNTFAVGLGGAVYLGPHIGDLENLETLTAFEDAVERMEEFLRVKPEVVAHDLHPLYVSTGWALRSQRSRRVTAVQHHHAHVASAMAEHGLSGPALGLAWDGTGYGTDGTSWGGELLLASGDGGAEFTRLGTFRPLKLAGGETAIREPWRIALALLTDAYPDGAPLERLPLFSDVEPGALGVVTQMLETDLQTSLARGVGRYFDAFGSLFLRRPFSRFEGQVALAWNGAADERERDAYPYSLTGGSSADVDLRLTVRAAVEDFFEGASPASISARFHETLARAAAALVSETASEGELAGLPIVLTGGCFANALLAERVLAHLAGRRVLLQRRVPPGDGGLALGQAFVAGARLRHNGL
jgi:hydrogenase maturation protein HypF